MKPVQEDPCIIRSLRGHKESISALSFHPGCRYVASAGMENVIMLWDLYNQVQTHKFIGHKSEIHALKFSPSGNMLASVSKDETLRFWEVNFDTNHETAMVKAHNARIRNLAFTCDGLIVGTCGDDKLIKLWSTQDRRLQSTLKGHKYWVRNLEFSPTAVNLASCDDKNILVWDVETKKQIQQYTGEHNGVIHSVRFHKLGNCLASCSHDRRIKIYDLRTQKVIQNYEAHKGPVTSIDFHPYSATIISSSDDGKTKIWDLKKGCLSYTLDTPSCDAVFSRHGDYFLTGGTQKLLNVWKTGFTDSGRENININDNALQKNVTRNVESEDINGQTFGVGQTQLGTNEAGTLNNGRGQPEQLNNEQYIIEKENLRSMGNDQLIYDHRPEEHFEIASHKEQRKSLGQQDTRIPSKLATKLKTLSCQLDFITKTVQVLDARVANNEEQLSRLKSILK